MTLSPFAAKGIFIHMRTAFPRETPAALLVDGGFKTVYIKGANGNAVYNVLNWSKLRYEPNITQEFVDACHRAGISVIGWGMNLGIDPFGEGKIAAQQVNTFGLDGWVFDIEEVFDLRPDAVTNVVKLITSFKALSSVPLGYCSWPTYANAHPVAVAKTGMQLCDVGISMAYSMRKNIKEQADEGVHLAFQSVKEWRIFTDKPLVLAGRAFKENGYTTNPDAILAFNQTARLVGSIGSAWWFLDHAQPCKQPDWWNALKSTPQYDGTPYVPPVVVPPAPITVDYVVNRYRINVREGSNINSAWLGYANLGDVLHVDKTENGYSHAVGIGWVYKEYITLK